MKTTVNLLEKTKYNYIFINPKTNIVHLFMPIVRGTQIGLDNTCKSAEALKSFFAEEKTEHSVLYQLRAYKAALEFDLSLLRAQPDLKKAKAARLEQINHYIAAVNEAIKMDDKSATYYLYPPALHAIMGSPDSNLYSMLLRPATIDAVIRTRSPVFSIDRDQASVFCKALSDSLQHLSAINSLKMKCIDSIAALVNAADADFGKTCDLLTKIIKQRFNIDIDCSKTAEKEPAPVDEEFICRGLNENSHGLKKTKETIEALLYWCSPNLFEVIDQQPFERVENIEQLKIVTQFFLATINIYCRAKKISSSNFGKVLDSNKQLSEEVAKIVASSIGNDLDLADNLLNFINKTEEFGLEHHLGVVEKKQIISTFREYYSEIQNSGHFDEFIVLDTSKHGPFIVHQSCICLDFADFIKECLPQLNREYFQSVSADFKSLHGEITHTNPCIHASIELEIATIAENLKDVNQFNQLLAVQSAAQKNTLTSGIIAQQLFLYCVARGQQDIAEQLLKVNSDAEFLLREAVFTDYSGRQFECNAYSYAYWAMDIFMCDMLAQRMDDRTKKIILDQCNQIESNGLCYYYMGEKIKGSKHFDLTPLLTALKQYKTGYDDWYKIEDWEALKKSWLEIGLEQTKLPANLAQEYCREDSSFDPRPNLKKKHFPRSLAYYNGLNERYEQWFPLYNSKLGLEFAIYKRATTRANACPGSSHNHAPLGPDFEAINSLCKERTEDLIQLRKNLESETIQCKLT